MAAMHDAEDVSRTEFKGPLEVVSIILARQGSRRLPNKNIAYLGQKRLLEWAINAAIGSGEVSKVFVSTDSTEYAEIARSAGALVIPRPPEYATEDASSESAMKHALDYLSEQGVRPFVAVLQQPTTPLTRPITISRAVKAVKDKYDTAMSVIKAKRYPWWGYTRREDGGLEPFMVLPKDSPYIGENPPPIFYPTGGVYAFRVDYFKTSNQLYGGNCFGVDVEWYEGIDVDTEYDLGYARYALKILDFSIKDAENRLADATQTVR